MIPDQQVFVLVTCIVVVLNYDTTCKRAIRRDFGCAVNPVGVKG